jgi:uncharacterized protein YbjT (DUF2867 family)
MQTHDRPSLVLGGTGHYGRHIVRHLQAKGVPVRVLSRNATNARRVLGDRPAIVEGDITSRASVQQALAGARALVISISAFSPKLIRRLEAIERDAVLGVLEAAQEAGVSRVVYISVFDIREDVIDALNDPTARCKLAIETALARSDLNWTVLGAAPSVELFFAMIRGNRMVVPGGGPAALPTVSPADVGEIAAQAVLRDDLAGLRIRMVGPEALSFPEAARRISAATGQEIRFLKVPLFPLRIASAVAGPVYPYVRHLVRMIRLMNHFPQDAVAQAAADHQRLRVAFDYTPTSLEMEARARRRGRQKENGWNRS